MWSYVLRKILAAIPVYLGIILLVMLALRVNDPIAAYLGKNATPESIGQYRSQWGLDRPVLPVWATPPEGPVEPWLTLPVPGVEGGLSVFPPWRTQYVSFVWSLARLDLNNSWEQKRPVAQMLRSSVGPSLAVTLPALALTTSIAVTVGLLSAYFRGRLTDRVLMFASVLGMSVSVLVFIILGQYFGAYWPRQALGLNVFAIEGYDATARNWAYYCLLPVLISLAVSLGYDARFYRAVMVEEGNRDYITTARAKGASKPKIMFVHMLKNAMIPIITHVMITLPFIITGSILLEQYFNIPGMGRTLITAIASKDFPVIQSFTAVFALVFIASNILTDVLYALVDPRVRLS
ncbi:MAG: hypothetical protein C0475_03095 [Planctomyces sp.]|nr:hypothetical protein [Planctomyces sp.]MBA4119758.1 hypothetical protein [Isosphaera sp.]